MLHLPFTNKNVNDVIMYNVDRRRVALHIYGLLNSLRKTSKLLQVSHSTISRWLRQPERKPYPTRKSKTTLVAECIRASISNNPFISNRILSEVVYKSLGVNVSRELVRVAIKRQGFTLKCARFHGRPPDIDEKVTAFVKKRDELLSQGREFVSLDETSFGRHGRPVKGYARKGTQLFVQRRNGPRVTTTSMLVGISSTTGRLYKASKQGAYNSVAFVQALESFDLPRGSVVLLDNASIHHTHEVKTCVQKAGIELMYVPPYSPWFNPVEGVFSIAKRHFYKHSCPEKAIESVTRDHIESFFRVSFETRESPDFVVSPHT